MLELRDQTGDEVREVVDTEKMLENNSSSENQPTEPALAGSEAAKGKKTTTSRPALQIYRPPGLRSDAKSAKPLEAAGAKQPKTPSTTNNNHEKHNGAQAERHSSEEVNNNTTERACSPASSTGSSSLSASRSGRDAASPLSPPNTSNGCTVAANSEKEVTPTEKGRGVDAHSNGSTPAHISRTESSLSGDSAFSQKSQVSGDATSAASEPHKEGSKEREIRRPKPNIPTYKKEKEKKRNFTPQEMLHAGVALRALSVPHCVSDLEALIASEFASEQAGEAVGASLARHAIEANCGRNVAKAAMLLKEAPSFTSLHAGLLNGVREYLDTREVMRKERFRAWIALLGFITDLYANVGDNEQGDLVSIVFEVFGYLLRPPILDGLKIEELESLISTLLGIGYDLERECPDQLAALKDLIRDAFIEVSEPWARKMILLMLELSASDWKLPEEANEYYFQQTTN